MARSACRCCSCTVTTTTPVRRSPPPGGADAARLHGSVGGGRSLRALDGPGAAGGGQRHADVLAVLRDPATFSSENPQAPYGARPPEVEQVLEAGLAGESGLLGRNPPDRTRLRAFVNKSFTPRSVAALEPSRATICRAIWCGCIRRATARSAPRRSLA